MTVVVHQEEENSFTRKLLHHSPTLHACQCIFPPHHCHPAESRDALANSWQVVKEAAAAVSFPEALDLLDVIRNGLQQVMKFRLHKKKKKKDREKEKISGIIPLACRILFFFKFYKHFWSCDICPASAVSKLRTDTNFTSPLFSPLELGDLPSHLSVATNIPRFTGRSLWPCKAYHFPSVYSSPVMRQRSRTSRDTVFCRRFAAAAVDWLPRETSVAKGTG